MSQVLSPINLSKAEYNSPSKQRAPIEPIDDESDDSFSFKLTQVCQNQKEAECMKKSPVKQKSDISTHLTSFDNFILDQRVQLPRQLEMANTTQQRELVLNTFFQTIDQYKSQIREAVSQRGSSKNDSSSPSKKPMFKKSSPVKSPQKKVRSKQNDENTSPDKGSQKCSPGKKMQSPVKQQQTLAHNQASNKEDRKSQQRRRQINQEEQENKPDEKEKAENNFLTVPTPSQSGETSPMKSCRKSPLKRMETLENREKNENQENIETTYIKTQRTQLIEDDEDDCEQMEDQRPLDPRFLQPEAPPQLETKMILGQQNELQDENRVTETQLQNQVPDINDILDVDSNVINYGQFICGKILGSTLLLTNLSDTDQIVTMQMSSLKQFQCDDIFGQYNRDELPFSYEDGTEIKNSEIDHNCWFIENPVSKELQKNITLKIGPKTNQEFIIVVKAPKNKLQSRIVSFIDITLQNDNQASSQEKHVSHKQERIVLKEQPIQRKVEILLLGFLDNPPIKCMRQLFNKATGQDIVSLAVKKTQGIQKFKLPFKNLSTYLDSDIEFAFIKTQSVSFDSDPGKMDPIECLQFYCQPNQLKIAADQMQILNVQIKVNTDTLLNEDKVDQRLLKAPVNKLLVARLKNSQVLFSFFISINLTD